MKKMPDKSNSRLLRSIHADLRQWRKNQPPPFEFSTKYGALFCSAVLFLIGTNYVSGPAHLLLLIFAGTLSAYLACNWIFRKLPRSWPESVDRKLAQYKPGDMAAWELFQHDVREKGKIDIAELQEWVDQEMMSYLKPEQNRSLLFLENTTGDKPKD